MLHFKWYLQASRPNAGVCISYFKGPAAGYGQLSVNRLYGDGVGYDATNKWLSKMFYTIKQTTFTIASVLD